MAVRDGAISIARRLRAVGSCLPSSAVARSICRSGGTTMLMPSVIPYTEYIPAHSYAVF